MEEIDRLRMLIESMSKPSGFCTLSNKGKSSSNTFVLVSQEIWILDYGATDHMTPFPALFASY